MNTKENILAGERTQERQAIDGGGWFNLARAQAFGEDSWWNGSNHISRATGSQWEHERLFITRKGVYVLNRSSDYQGSGESWTRISAKEGVEWLIRNEHEIPQDKALQEALASTEV